MSKLKATSEWLRAGATEKPIGVDREAGVIFGVVVAQEGPFKSEGRGEFDVKALKTIRKLMAENGPNGTKSRFTHPDMSNDGLGKFLGRERKPRMDAIEKDGKEIQLVRADLHFDPTALEEPVGGGRPLGDYVMALAESDPGAISSSLVLTMEEEFRIEKDGRPKRDEETGEVLPPLWRPQKIHASDIVDEGDAVDDLLSVDGLPDNLVRRGSALLDKQFSGCSREVVEARCQAYLSRYLHNRFGEKEEPEDGYVSIEDADGLGGILVPEEIASLLQPVVGGKSLRLVKR